MTTPTCMNRDLQFRKICCAVLLMSMLSASAAAQDQTLPPAQPPAQTPVQKSPQATPVSDGTRKVLEKDKAKDFPLQATATPGTVKDNVSVEAVLLPYQVCRRVFGTEIAKNYAAVELTISNRSPEASLIVHSVFIDYQDWALSGTQYLASSRTANESARKKRSARRGLPDYEVPNSPGQISSVEYRVARGELLDKQPWTVRNVTMRALQAAGSIASAYTFSIGEKGIVRGIGAYNGEVVPALEALFPDGTVGQMNRISDLGFQVNKVIPKNSSDIVVAFFPLDRFLTPGLKKLFLKSPALFFAPYALMFDHEARKALTPLITGMLDGDKDGAELFMRQLSVGYINEYVEQLQQEEGIQSDSHARLPLPSSDASAQSQNSGDSGNGADNTKPLTQARAARVMTFLAHASLNTIHVVVGGDMTIDVDHVAASISSITMDEGNDNPKTWTVGDHKGVIKGKYLTGGQLVIVESKQIGEPKITMDTDNSTDNELHFTMTLTKAIAPQNLTSKVVKTDKAGNTVESTPFVLAVQYGAAALDSALLKGTTLTVIGKGLSNDMELLLYSSEGKADADFTLDNTEFTLKGDAEADSDLSKAKNVTLATGCWTVKAQFPDKTITNGVQFPQTNKDACEAAKQQVAPAKDAAPAPPAHEKKPPKAGSARNQ